MSQISKNKLQKDIENRVYEILMESVASARSSDTVTRLLEDLFSPTERMMIAKRLSIALLLMKKYDQRTISRWLKVSLGTVSKVSLTLQKGNGGYQTVIGSILRKEELKVLIEKIDDTLHRYLPPPALNWSNYHKLRWEEKMKNAKAF